MKGARHRPNRSRRDLPSALPENRARLRSPNSISATEAKNAFGAILEKAIRGETMIITKHDTPKAVLISIDQFEALKRTPELTLDTLGAEFDALLARMQQPKARAGMKVAYESSSRQLGHAALAAARRHD